MRDARDAEDKRLLEAGEIELLLAGWYETIVGRCVAQMRGPVGHDVAQVVCERLWRELKRGKHRDGAWPFRVIVHKVIEFTCTRLVRAGLARGRVDRDRRPEPGPERRRRDAARPRDVRRDAAAGRRARWRGSGCWKALEPDQIAERARQEPNAVYQARWRIAARLREWLEA